MIKIKNAYENNLKNISLDIPHNQITSIIGVSGSGKSTLIYNVLANEAKRREKIDSGNANCFDYAIRPKFDSIENLPYCITLKQRGLQQSVSSTLATITKLHELLREEFSKYGQIVGDNGNIINEPTVEEIKEFIKNYHTKEKFECFAIVCDRTYTDGEKELNILKKANFAEAIFISSYDEKERLKKITSIKELNSNYHHTILVPIKSINDIDKYENIALDSFLIKNKTNEFYFKYDFPDLSTGKMYQNKSLELLSFNSISYFSGKCKECNGTGKIETIDMNDIINKNKYLNEFFLNLEDNAKGCYKYIGLCQDTISKELKKHEINENKKYFELTDDKQKIIKDIVFPKILKHQAKPSIGKFVKTIQCPTCNGSRLNYKANAVKLHGISISKILSFTVDELYNFLKNKTLHHKKILIILKSIQKSTLGYLTLDRTTDTLSGGELQRLKFAMELNSEYKNLLYILDEPSTGLHPYNNHQMIHLIQGLKDKGNTVILSEHNQDYIQSSNHIIELGYGSGDSGGEIIFQGKTRELQSNNFKRVKKTVDLKDSINLVGVTSNNIQNEDFIIPLNCLVAISGVSGSGKSSLIHKVLVPSVKQYLADNTFDSSLVENINGLEQIKSIVELTQSQIGINSRSIVATYLNIFDKIRDIFANLEIAKEFEFDKSYFSFNSNIGACETCNGLGEIDNILCPNCLGQRYKAEVLNIKYNQLNIIELLNTQIDKLSDIFEDDKLKFAFQTLVRLGLSHISLGRTTPTLSGGEAQRLKLAKTLIDSFAKIKKGNFIFILDEPTTGLNNKDTEKIYSIFDEILSHNNSIIIIEHNLEIIKNSDYIIDMGIGSGNNGGKNIFSGSFEELLEHPASLTAKALNKEFEPSEDIQIDTLDLLEKKYNSSSTADCNKFYLDNYHFKIEKEFARNYEIITDNEYHKYFKTKEQLFGFVENLSNIKIYFNPYVTELFNYKIVPQSIKKNKLKHLKKLGCKIGAKDFDIDEWEYRVQLDDLNTAYNFGNGWITVVSNDIAYELFTRLVTIKNKIIGTPKIDEKTFNLYLNSCKYCDGSFSREVYDKNLIIADEKKSILEQGFFNSNISLNLKNVIAKFQKENLFDLSKPFNQLSIEEQNIFLFGFYEYKFLKPKGRINAINDYIRWQGIFSYVYQNLSKIKIANEIKASQHSIPCPFCKKGFKEEIKYYTNKEKLITNYLECPIKAV